jgi:hypothetical protein
MFIRNVVFCLGAWHVFLFLALNFVGTACIHLRKNSTALSQSELSNFSVYKLLYISFYYKGKSLFKEY